MPPARIHEAIAKEINKNKNYDELLLRIGTVAPDSWRNVETGIKDKYTTHFWNFKIKEGQANDYQEFYLKYYNDLSNPFYFGYLIHLIVDQYWKTNIDPLYITEQNGIKGFKLKDGTFKEDKDNWSYYDSLKMQRQIAKIYNLDKFPIEKINLKCNIDEINQEGIFGKTGTLNYINENCLPNGNDEEPEISDINVIIKQIKETAHFVQKELEKLEKIKKQNDKKIKIIVDIENTILYTSTYREKIAIKPGIQQAFNTLLKNDCKIDLISTIPLEEYTSLKKKLVQYFEENDINYDYLNLIFYSKQKFLQEHNYDILIDNDIRQILEAEKIGITPILYGTYNEEYKGYQTNNWEEIPKIIEKLQKKVKK